MDEAPKLTVVVVGRNYWGRGATTNEARKEFRRAGGEEKYGYTVYTFGPGSEFDHVHSVDGSIWWRGKRPDKYEVQPKAGVR